MGKKKALLIGCNYPGTDYELRGCVNDVNRIRRSLLDRFGFRDSDITVLIDTDPSSTQPTGANVRRAIGDLIGSAEAGDYLFVHYSGHGTRLPAETGEDDDTGYDECIVPSDLNLITDDDFRDFVDDVPNGCLITIVSDSCHSGGLIDKSKEQIGESTKHKEDKEPSWSMCDLIACLKHAVQSVCSSLGIHFLHEGHHHPEADDKANLETDHIKNRSLPLSTLIDILKQKAGKDDIDVGKIRPTLFHMFGEDASPKIKKFMKVILSKLQLSGNNESDVAFMNMIGNLQQLLKQKLEENENYVKPALETKIDNKQEVYAGANKRTVPVNGILVSACQTDQKSADAKPDSGEAYGAFSHVIQIILAESTGEISNKELVLKARVMLAKQGFSQRPGLYCSDDQVDASFVCP